MDQSPSGYSKVAAFQSSDRNFMQYRSFGYLHSRVLLALQYDVERLEIELDELDTFDKSDEGDVDKLCCRDRDDFESSMEHIESRAFKVKFKRTRPQVVQELKAKLTEYGMHGDQLRQRVTAADRVVDEMLLKTKQIACFQRPSQRDYESVRNWFNIELPLVEDEATFIQRKEDIVTLRTGRECAAFDGLVERSLAMLDRFLTTRCGCRIVQVSCLGFMGCDLSLTSA